MDKSISCFAKSLRPLNEPKDKVAVKTARKKYDIILAITY